MITLKTIALGVSLMISSLAHGQEPDSVLTLLFAGDIMGHDAQINAARNDSTGIYCYDSVFKYISPLLTGADVAIGNLEVTLGGAPFKGYPAFSSPDALAAACRNAGFDILVNANNHAADRRARGITRTIRVLDSLNIRHTGTWISSEARDTLSPLMICHDSIRVALLSYTYGTNGIVVPPPAIVSYIDTLRAADDIRKAATQGADLTVIFIHWGNEYDTLSSTQQKKTAAALLRNGADIIIGSHPHVLQPMIANKDSVSINNPVVWSMGNFVSNQRTRRRDGGAMIRLDLTTKGDTTVISDAGYILTWVYTPTENGKRRFYILPCAAYENRPEFFQSSSHYDDMMIFIKDARRLLDNLNTGISEMTFAEGKWTRVIRQNVSIN
ncbi:MAG: CapA family protein [Bacteroidales bacterium]|jgi:poly-gamma-glutamate synthesis protein (capsule biosynthesis protein)|nr:CapA family protein [Bacteroidales bacterium]